jgi:hypothetical protein
MNQQYQQHQNGAGNGGPPSMPYQRDRNMVFDGKRMRKAISRKYIDFNSTILNYAHVRFYYTTYYHVCINHVNRIGYLVMMNIYHHTLHIH